MKGRIKFQDVACRKIIFIWMSLLALSACLLFANLSKKYLIPRPPVVSYNETSLERDKENGSRKGVLNPDAHIYRQPETKSYNWIITSGVQAPDGVNKRVYLINGDFPGPTIEARSGDTLSINVINNLASEEGVSIHWHGLYMRRANEMDGAIGITQRPILPGSNFIYKFHIADDQAGTFWYHSHAQEQSGDGLWGGLIVHRPAEILNGRIHYGYDEEFLLQIGDWYHHPASELLAKYQHWSSAGAEPGPDSILINGVGSFDCSMLQPNSGLDCNSSAREPIMQLEIGKKYRLRITNVGSLTGLTLSIPGSKFTLIQVDGGHEVELQPATESIGILYPGQRMDFILEIEDPQVRGVNPGLIVALDEENFIIRNLALTSTQTFPIQISSPKTHHRQINVPHHKPSDPTTYLTLTNLTSPFPPLSSPSLFPSNLANKTILLYTTLEINSLNKNTPTGYINRTTCSPQSVPLISIPRKEWDDNQLIVWTGKQEGWVDIVVNNMDINGHPFHLHGNSFHILTSCSLSYGPPYNPFSSHPPKCGFESFNFINPVMRDTVYIPGRGYVVLRFKADNWGIWMFHCHLLWHHGVGMAMGIQVGGGESGVL